MEERKKKLEAMKETGEEMITGGRRWNGSDRKAKQKKKKNRQDAREG